MKRNGNGLLRHKRNALSMFMGKRIGRSPLRCSATVRGYRWPEIIIMKHCVLADEGWFNSEFVASYYDSPAFCQLDVDTVQLMTSRGASPNYDWSNRETLKESCCYLKTRRSSFRSRHYARRYSRCLTTSYRLTLDEERSASLCCIYRPTCARSGSRLTALMDVIGKWYGLPPKHRSLMNPWAPRKIKWNLPMCLSKHYNALKIFVIDYRHFHCLAGPSGQWNGH